ncbi:hypothetical protein M1D80_09460 [Phyllobacteriaceae bacterium JZ32]
MNFQKAFDETFEAVKGYIDRSFASFEKRIEALEVRAPHPAQIFRDAHGHLIGTMSDGSIKDLGDVVGPPGARGEPGQDGFGFDDLSVEYDGARQFSFKFTKGDRVKEFPFTVPVMLDRGVYKADTAYEAGDVVTWAGSMWIAQESTTEKPDAGKSWRLAVKRGRDGKDGVVKEEKLQGPIRVGKGNAHESSVRFSAVKESK